MSLSVCVSMCRRSSEIEPMRRCVIPVMAPPMRACCGGFVPAAAMSTSAPRRPRRHLIVTPYDAAPMNLEPPKSVTRTLSEISSEAGVPNDWRELSPAESRRLLEVLPAYVDQCKEYNIKVRRLHTYADLRRQAGHRARRRMHAMLDRGASEEKMKQWCSSHMFPAEP